MSRKLIPVVVGDARKANMGIKADVAQEIEEEVSGCHCKLCGKYHFWWEVHLVILHIKTNKSTATSTNTINTK